MTNEDKAILMVGKLTIQLHEAQKTIGILEELDASQKESIAELTDEVETLKVDLNILKHSKMA